MINKSIELTNELPTASFIGTNIHIAESTLALTKIQKGLLCDSSSTDFIISKPVQNFRASLKSSHLSIRIQNPWKKQNKTDNLQIKPNSSFFLHG